MAVSYRREQVDRNGKEKESSYFIVTNVSGYLQHDIYCLIPCSVGQPKTSASDRFLHSPSPPTCRSV